MLARKLSVRRKKERKGGLERLKKQVKRKNLLSKDGDKGIFVIPKKRCQVVGLFRKGGSV